MDSFTEERQKLVGVRRQQRSLLTLKRWQNYKELTALLHTKMQHIKAV
jgi:hypothetical protein